MSVNPKHCPFCGNSTITADSGAVSCYQCSAKIELQNCNTHYAVERWNTRAVESELAAQKARIAELVEGIARCRQQASYFIGNEEALKNQLSKVRDIANEILISKGAMQ